MLSTEVEPEDFQDEYAARLREYLLLQGEDSLRAAYELGRRALSVRMTVVEVVTIHAAALGCLDDRPEPSRATVTASMAFLAECLAPYEMVLRGYRSSVDNLRAANEDLARRAAELARANEEIRRLARDRTAFLAEATRRLVGSLDYETTLQVAADVGIPRVADWTVIDIRDGTGNRKVLSSNLDAERCAKLHIPERCPPPEGIERVFQLGRSEHLRSPAQDGASRCHLAIVPLVARGRTVGVLSLGFESIERSSDSQELSLAEELGHRAGLAIDNARLYREAANAIRVRDDFLSVASHELKTPLTPLVLTLQNAIRMLDAGREGVGPILARTLSFVRRLSTLVSDLLDVSRIQGGHLALSFETVTLSDLVREQVELFRQVGTNHAVSIELPDTPLVIRVDRFRLEQVISNLLDNALKYSPGGGEVKVKLEALDAAALLTVSDQGIGIPEDQQSHVFDRFFRGVNAPTHNYGGLGLGLHISRDIVTQHGGQMWLQSTPNRGTSFFVLLPCAGPQTSTA